MGGIEGAVSGLVIQRGRKGRGVCVFEKEREEGVCVDVLLEGKRERMCVDIYGLGGREESMCRLWIEGGRKRSFVEAFEVEGKGGGCVCNVDGGSKGDEIC